MDASAPSRLLEIRGLSASFRRDGATIPTLHDVDLTVDSGEIVTVVGESGSGKTVTARSILRLVPSPPISYDAGEILFEGEDLLRLPERRLRALRGRDISMVFQDPTTALNPVFTIGTQMQNVFLYQGGRHSSRLRAVRHSRRTAQARERSIELLAKMSLPDPEGLLDRYPFELSGGMCQRIVIALAMVHRPKLLIADEPGTALDVTVQASINAELRRLVEREGIAMIYITHNLGVAKHMGSRTYVMERGRVVESGPTQRLFEDPQADYTKALIAAVPRLTWSGR